MNDESGKYDGGLSEADVIALVGSAFDEGRRGRDAQDVVARGRRLRRRKRAMPALGVLGIVAVSTSLALTLNGHGGSGDTNAAGTGSSLSSHGEVVNVQEAGLSIHTDTKTGGVTAIVGHAFDEAEMKALLAKAGVATAFRNTTLPAGSTATPHPCTWTGATTLDSTSGVGTVRQAGNETILTIYPSKMPAGSVLGLNYGTIGSGKTVAEWFAATLLSGEPTGCAAN